MKNNIFKGTGVALITPFNNDQSVDIEALRNIVKHVIDNGADFLVALGTTSEAATMTADEKNTVLRTILSANAGRLPVMLGMGGNCTAAVIDSIKHQDFEGIGGILSVVPYYNKPNQRGMEAHFTAIADVSPVPVTVYNVPGRTGVNMASSTTLKLAQHHNITAIKEASGNMTQIMEILANRPADFDLLSGDDSITMPMMAMGANGVISVAANAYPNMFKVMTKALMDNDITKATKAHLAMLRMNELIFADGNPAGIKALMSHLGLCKNILRLPLVTANDKVQNDIFNEWDTCLSKFSI